jgi:hypothetical protein
MHGGGCVMISMIGDQEHHHVGSRSIEPRHLLGQPGPSSVSITVPQYSNDFLTSATIMALPSASVTSLAFGSGSPPMPEHM